MYTATVVFVNIGSSNSIVLIRQQPITWNKADSFK